MTSISDTHWLKANLDPAAGRAELGIRIPDLPPDDVQVRFTGRSGRANLEQAFEFYRFVLTHLPREQRGRFRLIDFGGGWGRVLRFFLRDYPAERFILFDCLTDAVECARSLKPPYAVLQNGVAPPLPLEAACADCCYAFSVFSHLSERACAGWLSHLGELLVPNGRLIFTTRGIRHIEFLRHSGSPSGRLPHPDELERRYAAGEFQFYPTGGGGELTDDFYGEAWITERWMDNSCRTLGFRRSEFVPEFGTVDQCVFVLTK
jgi:hypothetical protein